MSLIIIQHECSVNDGVTQKINSENFLLKVWFISILFNGIEEKLHRELSLQWEME